MSNESRLSIVIESRNAKQQAADLTKALEILEAAGIRVTATTTGAGKSAQEAGNSFSKAGKDAKSGSTGVDSLNKSIEQTDKAAATAAASMRRMFIGALAGFSTMGLIDAADEWGQYASRIKNATKSAEEYEYVQKRMMASAKDTFRHINETRESFIQMYPVLREMGMSLDQSIDAIDTFSGLLVVNAASADKGANAMNALAKSFQKGKIDAESWMSIYTTVDSIVETIAESSGMAGEEIRKLGAEGKLSIDVLAKALVDGNSRIMAQVREMPTTTRDALRNISNGFQEWIGKTNEASGATAVLVEGLNLVGNNIDLVANVLMGAGVTAILMYTLRQGLAIKSTVQAMLATRQKAAADLQAAKAQVALTAATLNQARANATLGGSTLAVTRAQKAHTASLAGLSAAQAAASTAGRAMLGALGGIPGIAISLGLAVASFLSIRDASAAAKEAVIDFSEPLDDIIKKFKELNKIEQERTMQTLKEEIADATTQLDEHLEKLTDLGLRYRNNEDVKMFVEGILQLRDAKLPAEELEATLIKMRDELRENLGPAYGRIKERIDDVISSSVDLAKTSDKLVVTERKLNEETNRASIEMGKLSQAMAEIKGMDKWEEYIGKLEAARDAVGMTTRELAEFEAAQKGANGVQAEMAGIVTAQTEEFGNLQNAIRDKDKKAQQAAIDNIRMLDIERQKVALLAQQMASVMAAAAAFRKAGVADDVAAGALIAMNEGFAKRSQEIDTVSSGTEAQIKRILANTKGGGGKSRGKSGGKGGGRSANEDRAGDYIKQLNEQIALLGKETEYEKALTQIQLGRYGKVTEAQKSDILAKAKTLDLLKKTQEENEKYKKFIDEITGADKLTDHLEKIKFLTRAWDEGTITVEEYNKRLNGLNEDFGSTTGAMSEFAKQASANIQDSLGDTLKKLLKGDFDDIASAWGDMILDMVAQAAAANLNEALFGNNGTSGLIGNAIGSLFGGGGLSTVGGGAGMPIYGGDFGFGGIHLSTGGRVSGPGSSTSDSIPAWLSDGEYVVNAQAVRQPGALDLLEALNEGKAVIRRASGGAVGQVAGAPMPPANMAAPQINIINNSSQPLQGQANARFDGEQMIIDVVVSNLQKNGEIAQSIKHLQTA